MSGKRDFDVLVIGGGHAGAEAAWAAARLGAATALVTFDRAAIGRMSCNPAIGGIGKGQMVREIDALGGLMGVVADETGIQFRMLNRSKGPAVWAPRAQSDREHYAAVVQRLLADCPNLAVIEAGVEAIVAEDSPRIAAEAPEAYPAEARDACTAADSVDDSVRDSRDGAPNPKPKIQNPKSRPPLRVTGVLLSDGRRLRAPAVVVTSGTFLRALMHTGEEKSAGGRVGEQAAAGLSASLAALGLELGRLKTGTPPRLDRSTIDFARLEEQQGDERPTPFSFMTERIAQPQVCCWITHTNAAVHELIRANLHRAPMYSGQIQSRGPRYCPSIEDKVVRFADKGRHQLFLEPEGRASERIYVNGISTSLPRDVQAQIVGLIEGLERARVLQWGYAVEYDFVPPEQIDASLMTQRAVGLFLAGQINGTSGYEEAAGQGLLAGINAARFVAGKPPVVLTRDQAYVGVMIDDLVTRGVTEPYRMFTSRAEHRLLLRYDNADERLTPLGRDIGLVDDARWRRFESRREQVANLKSLFATLRLDGRSLAEWLRRPDEDGERFDALFPQLAPFRAETDLWARAVVDLKYAGYVEREQRVIERLQDLESRAIPDHLDFSKIPHLRREAVERWTAICPRSVGQASRASGITPSDVSILMIALAAQVQ